MSYQAQLDFEPPAAAGGGFTLRPYQRESLEAVKAGLKDGLTRQLVALPTGTGKTVVFAHLPEVLGIQGRLLVLAHRQELLDQAADKIRRSNPGLSVGVEQADRRAGGAQVVVASVPTLQGKRLEALRPDDFEAVVCDEAHHSVANSYRRIFEHFGCDKPGGRPLIGFTATPKRGDNVGLSLVFDAIAYEMGIRQAIQEGWLVRLAGHRVTTGTDLSNVHTRMGEFVQGELADAVDTDERNNLVVASYQRLVPGRRALAFTVTVEHARRLAEAFAGAGVPAAYISGKTHKDERKALLKSFAAGELRILANCAVLTEGFDDPGVDALLMAKPTKSSLLYTQMVGRGTRLAPCKTDLQVIDFADNSTRHSLASAATLLGLPPELDLAGGDAEAARARMDEIEEQYPWINTSGIRSLADLEMVTQKIEFFHQGRPPELERVSRNTWAPLAVGGYRLSLADRYALLVEPTQRDTWRVTQTQLQQQGRRWFTSRTAMWEVPGRDEAVQLADRHVLAQHRESAGLVNAQARWRQGEASGKQKALLRKFGIPHPDEITKGQASTMLDMYFARRMR